mgnify:CR=1 FL=1
MNTYENAADMDFFKEDINTLSKYLILDNMGESMALSKEELSLKKSSWIASLLASSTDEEHQKIALDFGVLSFHYASTTNSVDEYTYKNLLYVITARTGTLPTLTYFNDSLNELESDTISRSDSVLSLELFGERDLYITDDGQTLSRFQNEIWNGFNNNDDIAISGPTSSGKSHIVKEYLQSNISNNEEFEAVYLVPTRALITENSTKLRGIINDIDGDEQIKVLTGAAEEQIDEDVIYILTPERCLNLLEDSEFKPDIIFIDEIQNIGDDSRGVLYEIVNSKLSDKWGDVRIVAAGPFLENGKELLDQSTNRDSSAITTKVAPVLQLRVSITFTKDNGLNISIFTPTGDKVTFDGRFLEHRTWNQAGNMKKTVPSIVRDFSRGNKNLVYCHKSNLAEQWAQEIAEKRDEVEITEEAERVINYLEEQIHPRYPLIDCLKSGVAFHHGKVPELARNAIESMYMKDEFLETVVSTPTLLQGVNLPCQEIFVLKPNKGNKDLSDFDFQNLIGRVGRLSENLFGVVYGVEREGEEWINEQMENTDSQEITSATDQASIEKKEELLDMVAKRDLPVDGDPAVRYTSILLRHKYLRGDNALENYLQTKEFSEPEIESIRSQLDSLLNLEIPKEIVFRNPSIDPVKQDKLYKEVLRNPQFWTFNPSWIDEAYFTGICRKLNAIFEFCADKFEDVYFDNLRDTETHLNFIGYIAEYAHMWINGKSYREIITKRIENASQSEKESTSIRKSIKTINNDVRFVLVKYFKILVDIVDYLLEENYLEEDEVSRHLMDLDTILERGSVDYDEINAMNAGLSRDMARNINIPDDEDIIEYVESNPQKLSDIERIALENKNII